MGECVERITTFCTLFEEMLGLDEDNQVLFAQFLSSDLRDSIVQEVNRSLGWGEDTLHSLLIQNHESVTTNNDGEYDGFDGAATAIFKYGLVSILAEDGVISSGWSMGFDQADSSTLSFVSWESDSSKGIYLKTGKNTSVSGFRWDYDGSIELSDHSETIANANSWLVRAFGVAKGEVDRDEVLFPPDEEPDTDELEVPQYISCKLCDSINELGEPSCTECGESLDGAMVLSDGSTYYGKLDENNHCTGFAYCVFANGDKYVGNYLNGSRHGHGNYRWANGEVFDGNWVNNLRHGNGVRTLPDGTQIEGEWVDDVYQEKKKSGFFSSLKEGFKEGYEGKK
jgi:hypothetical protein